MLKVDSVAAHDMLKRLLKEYAEEERKASEKGVYLEELQWIAKGETVKRIMTEMLKLTQEQNLKCEEEEPKHVVPYNDNPHDLDYAYWH